MYIYHFTQGSRVSQWVKGGDFSEIDRYRVEWWSYYPLVVIESVTKFYPQCNIRKIFKIKGG